MTAAILLGGFTNVDDTLVPHASIAEGDAMVLVAQLYGTGATDVTFTGSVWTLISDQSHSGSFGGVPVQRTKIWARIAIAAEPSLDVTFANLFNPTTGGRLSWLYSKNTQGGVTGDDIDEHYIDGSTAVTDPWTPTAVPGGTAPCLDVAIATSDSTGPEIHTPIPPGWTLATGVDHLDPGPGSGACLTRIRLSGVGTAPTYDWAGTGPRVIQYTTFSIAAIQTLQQAILV